MNITDIITYIVLGLVQGITEPLPISSSGHLLIAQELISNNAIADFNFAIIANAGSLLAILFLFKKDVLKITEHFFKYIKTREIGYRHNFIYALFIVLATIPAGLLGFIFKDTIERVFTDVSIVGIALLLTALFLFIIRNVEGNKKDRDITIKDAFLVGLFQAVAILPGVSRSGSTIVGASLRDFNRDTAIKFSFLLYIPISVATLILGVTDIISSNQTSEVILPYTLGAITSFIATYFSSKVFIDIVKKRKLIYFVYYCLIVGTLVLVLL